MPQLLETLAAELERPREVSAQVINHLVGTYGLTRDDLATFLVNELPKLEDFEIDLILSPLFTPTLADQSVFAERLGRDSIPTAQWPALVQQLVARPTRVRLVTADGTTHSVPLRDVTIERFVHRIRLDGTIPEPFFNLINNLTPATDRPMLKAIARRAVWEGAARREMLVHYLTSACGGEAYRLDDAVELLKLVETYQPADVKELLAHIPHWQQVLRQEINEAGSPKPFFNERVQELHGGGRDQRRQDNPRVTAKENERAFLERLQRVLAP
ncbi:MAG: hypothetical protein EXS35_06395 [Pedosphaera sp.]|nr:hypothetical protein [Pedosphaera sp.]